MTGVGHALAPTAGTVALATVMPATRMIGRALHPISCRCFPARARRHESPLGDFSLLNTQPLLFKRWRHHGQFTDIAS